VKVLVTGSRDWTDEVAIRRAFENMPRDTLIIDGMARGADDLAYRVTKAMGFDHHARFPAQWDKYGTSAGPRRNRLMFDTTRPDAVFAFPLPQSRGTFDMIHYATAQGCSVGRFKPRAL
jgi:hypothetical protein